MTGAPLAPRIPPGNVLALTAAEICGYLRSSFDRTFYIERYPDIALGVVDPLEHYALFGWKEGRDPSEWFSTQHYLADHADVARTGINPLLHYVLYGQHEGRCIRPTTSASGALTDLPQPNGKPTELGSAEICDQLRGAFDAGFYRDRYPDMANGLIDPLEHYAFVGWKEGRDPCDWFPTGRYLANHADVARKGENPLLHYVLHGQREGRRIWAADFSGSRDLKFDPTATFVTDANLRDLIRFPPRALCPPHSRLHPDRLVIHWLIPDFSPGSGGHMTIFRIVRWLEIMGHECIVWINAPGLHLNSRDAYDDIIKHYQTVHARVAFVHEGFDTAQGDVLIATAWQTVARAMNATEFRERCYFVQDYEANFHPMGSSALVANWTYTQALACICASPWLAHTLEQRYGRWARHFFLAYDREIYYPAEPAKDHAQKGERSRPRIALYARISTARRAVELAYLALEHLAADGVRFHIDLFGDDNTPTGAPFPCTSHGILNAGELADLYRNADIGICFSTTNYSLVPQEMMACGLPVVEIDGESTRAVFPEGVVTFTGPHPLAIAADIAALLKDAPRRRRQAVAALHWASQFDWQKSTRAVEHALLERIAPGDWLQADGRRRPATAHTSMKATVCIPTRNGGNVLLQVIEHVRSQRAPWPFEIVIVDSGSTDGSIERIVSTPVSEQPSLRVKQIRHEEFQHGRTRNLCASIAQGAFVAFLNQDALPADDFWLYNIVTVLEHFPRAAGALGRRIASPGASAFARRELDEHWINLARHPLALSRDTNAELWQSGDKGWRQVLRDFDHSNCCIRRSVWQRVPFPELDYGADQVWADAIIRLGHEKLYVPSAVVYHSHDETPDEASIRAATEAFFFATFFGYVSCDETISFDERLAAMQRSDMHWARANAVSQEELNRQLALNEARLTGRAQGMERARTAVNDGGIVAVQDHI
jgi:glycosyltransferase involved in cell wall biosynthesis/GT2 family glycosyltransferase